MSRWMTWLPISLKNAAKCDKWYQLQNLSITESLNANGVREKPPTAIPVHAVSLSVEQKPKLTKKESWFVENEILFGDRVVIPNSPSNRQFMDNECFQKFASWCAVFPARAPKCDQQVQFTLHFVEKFFQTKNIFFVTDLSAAGSPAELKHITQRRKRKQP